MLSSAFKGADLQHTVLLSFFIFISSRIIHNDDFLSVVFQEKCIHRTVGVDIYITRERMIILDTQVKFYFKAEFK